MKKIIGVVLFLSIVFTGIATVLFFSTNGPYRYNMLISLDQIVKEKGAQVQNVYQRRQDLIPNLMNTTRGYAKHEEKTFTAIADARARIGQVNVNPSDMTPEQMQAFESAQGQLGGALSRLMAIQENYPQLKADTLFLGMMTELEGTENRISTERREYNLASFNFNTERNQFPMNLFALVFRFKEKPYFTAQAGADHAPVVDFN